MRQSYSLAPVADAAGTSSIMQEPFPFSLAWFCPSTSAKHVFSAPVDKTRSDDEDRVRTVRKCGCEYVGFLQPVDDSYFSPIKSSGVVNIGMSSPKIVFRIIASLVIEIWYCRFNVYDLLHFETSVFLQPTKKILLDFLLLLSIFSGCQG